MNKFKSGVAKVAGATGVAYFLPFLAFADELSTTSVGSMILSSQTDLLSYLGTAIPLALGALVALIAAGWGIYLLVKYTRSGGKKV